MVLLKKLRKQKGTLQKLAYEGIRREIILGNLNWGQRLSEESLAAHLNISRTPVREAIFQLEKEGLVKKIPHSGFFVREFKKEDIEEIFKIRSILEPLVIDLVIENADQEPVKELQRNIKKCKRLLAKAEFDSLIEPITQFHEILSRGSKSRRLSSILHGLGEDALINRCLALKKAGVVESFVAQHEEILEALIQRDKRLAKETLNRHFQEARNCAMQILETESPLLATIELEPGEELAVGNRKGSKSYRSAPEGKSPVLEPGEPLLRGRRAARHG